MSAGMGEGKTKYLEKKDKQAYHYLSPEEQEAKAKYKAEKKKKLKEDYEEQARSSEDRKIADRIKINGKIYSSIAHAGRCIGLGHKSLKKHYERLMASKRSSIEIETRVARTFEFQKIKEGE